MTKAFIFDFDGVIVDTEHKRFRDLKQILKEKGKTLKDSSFFGFIGKKTSAFVLEEFSSVSKKFVEDIVKRRRELQFLQLKEYKLIKGIKSLVEFLKSRKLITAITTGSNRDIIDKILKLNKLDGFFDFIISGEDFMSSKPDPECYKVTLKKLKLKPSEVIVVEDSVAGVSAAKSAGCTVFAIRTYLDKDKFSKADKVFLNHFEILDYIKK